MTGRDWTDGNARALAIYLDGSDCPDRARDGSPMIDDDFLVLVNAWWEPLVFTIPVTRPRQVWQPEIDTYSPAAPSAAPEAREGDELSVGPRSMVVLRAPAPGTKT